MSEKVAATIRAALCASGGGGASLTARQRALVGDVLAAAAVFADLEPDDYSGQDTAVTALRETWERLTQAMPGATTVFAAQRG